MATQSTEGVAVLSYLAVMTRWKWLIIGSRSRVSPPASGISSRGRPSLQATAKLLYVQPVTISNPLVQGYSQTYQQPDIATVSAMVASSQVTDGASSCSRGRTRRPATS